MCNFFFYILLKVKVQKKSFKNSNIAFAKKNIFIRYIKHIIMNFESNSLKIYIHMIFIMIYLQMKCFRNFPTFLLQFQLFALCKEKIIDL